jgi:hypothetical protein
MQGDQLPDALRVLSDATVHRRGGLYGVTELEQGATEGILFVRTLPLGGFRRALFVRETSLLTFLGAARVVLRHLPTVLGLDAFSGFGGGSRRGQFTIVWVDELVKDLRQAVLLVDRGLKMRRSVRVVNRCIEISHGGYNSSGAQLRAAARR